MNAPVDRIPQRGVRRELLLGAAALVAGVALLPPLVWAVGAVVLGPYPGGLARLWTDYFTLLGTGSLAAWILLLGPYALISAFRILRRLARGPAR